MFNETTNIVFSNKFNYSIGIILTLVILVLPNHFIQAQSTTDLQIKIQDRASDIQALEKEIQGYQKQIETLNDQATSLASTIKSLELNEKKLAADIKLTENKISAKNIQISTLTSQILSKEDNIGSDRRIIQKSLATMEQFDDRSIIEVFLSGDSLASVSNALDNMVLIQKGLLGQIAKLLTVKADLETNKKATVIAKTELVTLKNQLNSQRKVIASTAAEKNALLKETKQSESQFQKILTEKKALQEEFEREVLDYESKLRLGVDPSLLPRSAKGVLSWPLKSLFITQYFGNTPFATANPQLYQGKGHTGIDLRASIGTPVMAALSGTIVGVGNTDLAPKCYSYGKWIMLKHNDGLSTVYGHLSLINVVVGEKVSTGAVIGYSGYSGAVSPPGPRGAHLHFGVFASQGVEIKAIASSKNCRGVIIPIADFKAYLNPMSYL